MLYIGHEKGEFCRLYRTIPLPARTAGECPRCLRHGAEVKDQGRAVVVGVYEDRVIFFHQISSSLIGKSMKIPQPMAGALNICLNDEEI